jgi:hypothetical protein
MLSWAMLNTENSSTRLMITGLVNSNSFMFLGNDDVRETLEVKIKLRKVDTFTQEQFVTSVHTYQALSRSLPGDFDATRWSNFLNAHPQILTSQLSTSQCPPAPLPPRQPPPPHNTRMAPLSAVQPDEHVPSGEWKENSLSSSEDTRRPRKRQRNLPRKTAKCLGGTGAKKKGALAANTPAVVPAIESRIVEDAPPLQISAESQLSQVEEPSAIPQQNMPKGSSCPPQVACCPQSEAFPSPRNANIIASSPPAQPEMPEIIRGPSPAPTSPCLPSLPLTQPKELPPGTALETLFEESESPPVKDEPPSDGMRLGGLLLPSTQPLQARTNLAVSEEAATPATNSLENSQCVKTAKKPKRRAPTKKDISMTPEPPERGDDISMPNKGTSLGGVKIVEKPKAPSKSRTAAHVRGRISMQLQEALKRGEMPNYCRNCGAIETAVWRKVKVPTDNPTEEKDDETAEKLVVVKEKESEVLLCNACGLWFITHKTMRPQQLWEANKEEKAKGQTSRKRKKSAPAPTPPMSTLTSDIPTEPIVLTDEDCTPKVLPHITTRAATTPTSNRSITRSSNPDWKSAIDASHRVTCSSPTVSGSANSPIDLDAVVDGMRSPKRRLFPEAGKSSPEKPVGHPMPKQALGKENVVPKDALDNQEDEEIFRPTTPTPTPRRQSVNHLRTPLRSATKVVHHGSPSKHNIPRAGPPATPERRLLKTVQQRQSLSPVAGLLEKLLADDPTALVTGLPDLSALDTNGDFLNTDYTMPSSPLPSSPPIGFNAYDDPDGVMSGDWSDFLPSTPNGGIDMSDLFNTRDVPSGPTVDLSAFIEEHTASGDIVAGESPAVDGSIVT